MDQPDSFISHKFKTLDGNCWRSLESSKFYFPAPEKLNDPADCQIDLAKAFRLARVNPSPREERLFSAVASRIESLASECGVFSLSSGSIDGNKERLLWAHYANNHTGICLTFEIPDSFVVERLVGCAPVQYSHDSLFEALKQLDLSRSPDFDNDLKPIVTAFLTTKSPEWSYEKEARLISFSPGEQEFDPGWLKQICFGLRTSDADRKRVKELAAKYPNCGLIEAVKSENDLFRLSLREVSNT